MEIAFGSSFKKVFKKKIKGTRSETIFWEKLEIFKSDPYQLKLKTHKLSGKLDGLWSFSIEYDLRVVFYFTEDHPKRAVLVSIGSHDEVY